MQALTMNHNKICIQQWYSTKCFYETCSYHLPFKSLSEGPRDVPFNCASINNLQLTESTLPLLSGGLNVLNPTFCHSTFIRSVIAMQIILNRIKKKRTIKKGYRCSPDDLRTDEYVYCLTPRAMPTKLQIDRLNA